MMREGFLEKRTEKNSTVRPGYFGILSTTIKFCKGGLLLLLYIYFLLLTEREELRIPEITTRHSSDWSASNVLGFSLHSRQIRKFIRLSAKLESDHVYRALIRSHTMLPPVTHRKKFFMYILT